MTLEGLGHSTIGVLSCCEQLEVLEDSTQWEEEHFKPPRVGRVLGKCALPSSEVQTNLYK